VPPESNLVLHPSLVKVMMRTFPAEIFLVEPKWETRFQNRSWLHACLKSHWIMCANVNKKRPACAGPFFDLTNRLLLCGYLFQLGGTHDVAIQSRFLGIGAVGHGHEL